MFWHTFCFGHWHLILDSEQSLRIPLEKNIFDKTILGQTWWSVYWHILKGRLEEGPRLVWFMLDNTHKESKLWHDACCLWISVYLCYMQVIKLNLHSMGASFLWTTVMALLIQCSFPYIIFQPWFFYIQPFTISGIVSSIGFSPTHNTLLAVGSYSRTTAIFTEVNKELLSCGWY